MVKPTILQSLLGKPSQHYSFPEEKVYYSTKQDMLRIAAETVEQATIVVRDDDEPSLVLHLLELIRDQDQKRPYGVRAFDNLDRQLTNNIHDGGDSDNEGSDDEVFYTPKSSPRASAVSTTMGPSRAISPEIEAVPSTKTSFTHANTSTTSISSSALDAHSLFSFTNSESTLMTSPLQSDTEQPATRVKRTLESPQVLNGHVDQAWSKDVRWLVPTPATKSTTSKKRQPVKVQPPHKPQTRTKPNTAMSKSISKMTPSIMSSMAALLEEDELQDTPTLHHPRSSVLISTPRRTGRSRMVPNTNPAPSLKKSSSRSLRRRRSRSLGRSSTSHGSSSSHHSGSSSTTSHPALPNHNSKYASSSADPYDRNTTSLPTFTAGDLPSHGTPGYTSLVLPRAPVPLSQTSHPSKGLFSLKEFRQSADVDGKVDLTRTGIAQTTMASVEVVRGLSGGSSATPGSSASKRFANLFRRGSTSVSSSASGPQSAFGTSAKTQGHDRHGKRREEPLPETIDLPLGFTSYRKPPTYVPSKSVLVQVWAVGVDGLDWRLVFGGESSGTASAVPSRSNTMTAVERASFDVPSSPQNSAPKRSVSLRSTLGRFGSQRSAPSSPVAPSSATPSAAVSYTPAAVVGYIPGRSFVGRVLECGWEVGEEVVKKGDWVVGLLDLKKCGGLTQFIVADRHRVHRAPYPRMQQDGLASLSVNATAGSSTNYSASSKMSNSARTEQGPSRTPVTGGRHARQASAAPRPNIPLPLSLEELALLPACGIPAYRAVRTFAFAFSDSTVHSGGGSERRMAARDAMDGARRRRALVLGGQDGAGALSVQMLVRRGWQVCVHVPFRCLPHEAGGLVNWDENEAADEEGKEAYCMRRVEERVRAWGGEEVIFDDGDEGAVVRVIDQLCEDGDLFDAVLDTVGGKEVWEASERLLKIVSPDATDSNAAAANNKEKAKRAEMGIKQFTTLVGDYPGRTIPSAGDNFKAGLRSSNFGSRSDGKKLEGKVGYAWVSYAQDVDWEGEDIRDTLREVLRTVTDNRIRPWLGDVPQEMMHTSRQRVVAFEKAHEIFVNRDKSVLKDGGTVVVKVVG
ncbi:hypothetical protein H0H92_006838 [Tricholoma furcatifolium]|nr:hypothetical protein H0H92_006838 [Tricholoma furcatifolium]